jgi:hypothetical protein
MLSAPSTHRVENRHHLAPGVGRARPTATQPHQLRRQRLDPKPRGDRRDRHHAGVTDRPLVIELDSHPVQSDRLVILHHEGDLLTQAPAAPYSRKMPAREVILRYAPDGTDLPNRWIRT